jgi:hypothetical protein
MLTKQSIDSSVPAWPMRELFVSKPSPPCQLNNYGIGIPCRTADQIFPLVARKMNKSAISYAFPKL